MTKDKGGRPTVFTEVVLQKLNEAFAFGATDKEACFYADIAESSLYNYQTENPKFLERKQLLKERPVLLARQSVVSSLSENPKLALKFLERKRKGEFGLKSELELSGNVGSDVRVISILKEIKKQKKDDAIPRTDGQGEGGDVVAGD